MVINNVNVTRTNQINNNCQIGTLISVAKIQGTSAEKNIIADTLVIATTNLTSIVALTTSSDGKNISMTYIADAFANNAFSAIGKI